MRELTARQKQILDMLAIGMTSDEIAKRLRISSKTLKTHRADILRRLHARHMPHAIALYFWEVNAY